MSISSNVTEQNFINPRKLDEQQKEQRFPKIKSRILKQTHDIKLAESLSAIIKKLDEVEETTQKFGDVINENNFSQVAIENTHNALPIEIEQIQPGVNYDTSLENTLPYMKKNTGFFKIEERDNGGVFWNGFPIEKMGGNKLKVNEKIYKITLGILKVSADTSNIPLKKSK